MKDNNIRLAERIAKFSSDIEYIKEKVGKIDNIEKVLHGNGSSGLITRVAILENNNNDKKDNWKIIFAGIIGGTFGLFFDFLKKIKG